MKTIGKFILFVFLVTQTAVFASQAILRLGQGNGELGSQNNIIKVYLENDVPVHALQMAVADIPDFLKPDSIWVTDRCANFIVSSEDDTLGRFNIILISFNPSMAIEADTGAILNISYSVAPNVNDIKVLDLVFYSPPTVYNKQEGKISTTTYGGKFIIGSTAVEEPAFDIPSSFELMQNYPNPFNPVTHIGFNLPARSRVSLDIFNLLGQRIRRVTDREYMAGRYELQWDGLGDRGEAVAAGVYLYQLRTDHFTQTRRMVLAK
ncbi:T9SS type A sorting domain-containing protein [candidate division KSB1 bacterium]|nr:T9SS type A sorting domain-containing protein [candidate division KSB1 bacterium]